MLETEVLDLLRKRGFTIAVAESCTGGRICDKLTNVPGCSDVFRGGVVVYSNYAKVKLLGVSHDTIKKHGAVSAECAEEMSRGVCRAFNADIGVSVTGIAGPDGGSPQKPVGLVYISLARPHEQMVFEQRFEGSRTQVKEEATVLALRLVLDYLM